LYFAPSTISAQYILSFIFLLISKVALESLANFENSGIPGFSAQTFPLELLEILQPEFVERLNKQAKI
jgi:hypothetical protein